MGFLKLGLEKMDEVQGGNPILKKRFKLSSLNRAAVAFYANNDN